MNRCSLPAAAAMLLLCAAQVQADLITNGTFNSNANGWTLGGGCVDAAWDGANGNPPGSILLNSCGEANSDPTASQTINGLVVGTTYTISVDVHVQVNASGGGTGKSFGIFLNNEPGNPILLAEFLDNSWHRVKSSFVAASSSATIIFAAELDPRTPGGPGIATDVSYFIDNVSVQRAGVASTGVPSLSDEALAILVVLLAVCAALVLRKRRPSGRTSV